MAQDLRIAVAGTGYFSLFHFDAWTRCPEVELVGVASLDERSRAEVVAEFAISKSFEDVREMLDGVSLAA